MKDLQVECKIVNGFLSTPRSRRRMIIYRQLKSQYLDNDFVGVCNYFLTMRPNCMKYVKNRFLQSIGQSYFFFFLLQ